jgi:TolA-binding protein
MNELNALGRELRRQLPDIPHAVVTPQLGRLLKDPRTRASAHRRHWFRGALSAAFATALIWALWPRAEQPLEAPQFFAAHHSDLEQVLSDGTRLHLDLGARGFASAAGHDGRQFTLDQGRVTFDVAPQKGRVFSVLAGQHVVRVLGTRFSVSLEPAGAFSVSVERGMVLVIPEEGVPVRLAAGERFDRGGELVEEERALQAATEAAAPAPAPPTAPAATPPATTPASNASQLRPIVKATAMAPQPGWHQLYRARQYAAALSAAQREGLGRLRNELEAAQLADLADVARLGGDLNLALDVLSSIEQRFPATEHASLARFLSGRVLVQLGRRGEAAAVFESYLAVHPDGTYGTEALGRLLELHAQRGDTARARSLAERYLQRAPDGPYRRLARSLTLER